MVAEQLANIRLIYPRREGNLGIRHPHVERV
jgi:hypothetical protein